MGLYKRQRNRPQEEQVTSYGKRQTPFYPVIKNKLREKGFVYFSELQPGQKASFFGQIIERNEQQKAVFLDGENKGQKFFVEPYTVVRLFM